MTEDRYKNARVHFEGPLVVYNGGNHIWLVILIAVIIIIAILWILFGPEVMSILSII